MEALSLTTVTFLAILLISLTCVLSKSFRRPGKKYPPGPYGIPFVGFLFQSFKGGENYLKKLLWIKKKYGKIATVRMGSFKCIWLNDYELVKEAFKNPVFCGRPKIPGITSRTHGFVGGLIFNDEENFKEQRRFVVKHLKNLGFGGKWSMENLILEEVDELVVHLKETLSKPISTRHLFNIGIMNVLWKIITGEKFKHDEPVLLELTKTLNRNMELNGLEKVAFFMPWLTTFFPSVIGWNAYVADATFIFEFWRNYSNSKIQSYCPNNPPEFFIDHYVKAIHDCNDPKSGFFQQKGELSLAATIQDLFIAGTETTSTTLSWALLYLAVYPHVQTKVFQEIDQVIGHVSISLRCRSRMPYMEAFLQEVMRHGTLAPLGIVHRATEDTELGGYFIPKDSIVQANIFAIHHDPTLWEHPQNFEPDRFLNPTRELIVKQDNFLPFSCGGRHCIGESLARDELFLFITSIIQNFRILPESNEEFPSLVPIVGVGSIPQAHKLIFYPR